MTPFAAQALLAVACSFAAPSATDPIVYRHDRSDADSIELAKRFDATVKFEPDGCGTLIGKRWVLTAAHVARGLSPFSPHVRIKARDYRVRQVLFHPESKSDGQRPPRVDLALVELEEEVEGVKPVALYKQKDEVGQAVFVVGYGDYGTGDGQLARMNGLRRAATNTVDKAEGGRLHLDFDAPPEGTELEGVGGPGDSGGPLYIESEAGLFLAGVSSASMGGRPGSYGVIDLYARVSEFADWIVATPEAVAGQPPQRPDIVELEQGFPEGQRGDLLEAFFASFDIGEKEALDEFAATFRSADSRRRNPAGAFTRRMLALRNDLGYLTPERVALVDPRHWIVLAETEKSGWRAVHFRFATEDEAVRLNDMGMRPEAAPRKEDAKDPADESGG